MYLGKDNTQNDQFLDTNTPRWRLGRPPESALKGNMMSGKHSLMKSWNNPRNEDNFEHRHTYKKHKKTCRGEEALFRGWKHCIALRRFFRCFVPSQLPSLLALFQDVYSKVVREPRCPIPLTWHCRSLEKGMRRLKVTYQWEGWERGRNTLHA